MRVRAKRDTLHTPIVRALRSAGRSVVETHQLGGGIPDLLVGWGRSVLRWMEVKDPKAGVLTPDQKRFFSEWRGPEIYVATSVEEALALTGVNVGKSTHGRSVARGGDPSGSGSGPHRSGSARPGNGLAGGGGGAAQVVCPTCGRVLGKASLE